MKRQFFLTVSRESYPPLKSSFKPVTDMRKQIWWMIYKYKIEREWTLGRNNLRREWMQRQALKQVNKWKTMGSYSQNFKPMEDWKLRICYVFI